MFKQVDNTAFHFIHSKINCCANITNSSNNSGTVVIDRQYIKPDFKDGIAYMIQKRLQLDKTNFEDLKITRKASLNRSFSSRKSTTFRTTSRHLRTKSSAWRQSRTRMWSWIKWRINSVRAISVTCESNSTVFDLKSRIGRKFIQVRSREYARVLWRRCCTSDKWGIEVSYGCRMEPNFF